MARGWHYTNLSLLSALLLFFFGMCFVLLFLSFCRFCFVFYFVTMFSLELCRCSSDIFLSSRPRITGLTTTYYYCILLGMVEARSVNVNTTQQLRSSRCVQIFL